jgi:subtilisin family serine protease
MEVMMASRSEDPRKPPKVRSFAGGKPPARVFSKGVSNIVPGELLVQLSPETARQMTASIARGPTRSRAGTGARAFGLEAVDNALRDLKIVEITSLHPPAPAASAAMAEAVQMSGTYRIRYSGETDADTAVKKLSNVPGVQYAEPNVYRETCIVPNDPDYPSQWGLNRINCPAAWDRTTGSPNIVVAVIDTGIDLDHPELAGLLVQGRDLVDLGPNPTPPPGWHFEGDFDNVDPDPQDEVGHGTHVAGTIACASNNNVGVAGVTWSCRLMPVRVLARIVRNSDGRVSGTGSAADIAAGIRWAVDNGARILNLSLGGEVDTQVERDAIAYAIAQGAVVCAAMGNAFQDGNPTSFPAAYPDVIAVGAIDQSDNRAAFSQTGPHIDVAAPGVGIRSTVWDDGYDTYQGTSMATPHVAGVAALILSCNPQLTAAQVGDIIRQTAQALRDNPADPVPNDAYGFGCVDAAAAIDRACPRPQPSVPITTCPTLLRCPPTVLVSCPSLQIICPSLQTICQSTISCPPTRPIWSCRSVITVCRTQQFVCPSLRVRCPSMIDACPSRFTICQSETVVCPSTSPVNCPLPSRDIHCPSGFVCGIDRPGQPPGFGMGMASGQGQDWQDWAAYDPYSMWNGE